MESWKPGDRVGHASYGAGTVIAFDDRHAVVHFDNHGRKTFASHLVALTEAQGPPPPPGSRLSRMTSERTTDVGYENLNEQTVIRRAALAAGAHEQDVFVLRCRRCSLEYGAHASDIHLRRCPSCMGGPPGLPV
jgi:hypothetical protein